MTDATDAGETKGDPERDPERGQAHVPKPPTPQEVEDLSRAQQYITDEWTGQGGRPKDPAPHDEP